MATWEKTFNNNPQDVAYSVMSLDKNADGMDALRQLFPDGEANYMNFVLFSTSGTHGSYLTLEEAEKEPGTSVTFLVVQPRLVTTRYGTVVPRTKEDFDFLYRLRESSRRVTQDIG